MVNKHYYAGSRILTAVHGSHGLPRQNVPARGHDPDVTMITARTRRRGHGPLHGWSRGVCRRRVRGDVLTYQGTWLRPAGEAPSYPRAGGLAKKIASTALPAVRKLTCRRIVQKNARYLLKSRNGYAPASESPADG